MGCGGGRQLLPSLPARPAAVRPGHTCYGRFQTEVRVERAGAGNRAPTTRSCVKYGSDTRSGPRCGRAAGWGRRQHRVKKCSSSRSKEGCERVFGLLRYKGESHPGGGGTGQGLHLVSWCCQSVPRQRGLAPIVHGVGWDGHGRGHRDGGAAHGELAVDRVVGTGAAAAAALGAGGPCGVGCGH